MDFMGLCLRECDRNGNIYSPYAFYPGNDFTQQEKELIRQSILKYEPEKVDSMFNNWIFGKNVGEYFTAKRATWYNRVFANNTLAELLSKIEDYYTKI
jgi:hypothetical protein